MSQRVKTDVILGKIKEAITCLPVCQSMCQYIGSLVHWLGKGGQKRNDNGYFFNHPLGSDQAEISLTFIL